jgi:hypothetical protein
VIGDSIQDDSRDQGSGILDALGHKIKKSIKVQSAREIWESWYLKLFARLTHSNCVFVLLLYETIKECHNRAPLTVHTVKAHSTGYSISRILQHQTFRKKNI